MIEVVDEIIEKNSIQGQRIETDSDSSTDSDSNNENESEKSCLSPLSSPTAFIKNNCDNKVDFKALIKNFFCLPDHPNISHQYDFNKSKYFGINNSLLAYALEPSVDMGDEQFKQLKEWIESYGLLIDKLEATEEERVKFNIPLNANKTFFVFVAPTKLLLNSAIRNHKKERKPTNENHIKGVSLKSMQKFQMAKSLVKEKLLLPDIPSTDIVHPDTTVVILPDIHLVDDVLPHFRKWLKSYGLICKHLLASNEEKKLYNIDDKRTNSSYYFVSNDSKLIQSVIDRHKSNRLIENNLNNDSNIFNIPVISTDSDTTLDQSMQYDEKPLKASPISIVNCATPKIKSSDNNKEKVVKSDSKCIDKIKSPTKLSNGILKI